MAGPTEGRTTYQEPGSDTCMHEIPSSRAVSRLWTRYCADSVVASMAIDEGPDGKGVLHRWTLQPTETWYSERLLSPTWFYHAGGVGSFRERSGSQVRSPSR